jgi:hypothetical protein
MSMRTPKKLSERLARHGRRCLTIAGDVGERFCKQAIEQTNREFGRLDILIDNAAEQHPQENIKDISSDQLEPTSRTNIFSFFYTTKVALKYLPEGGSIVNTTSVTAYRGSSHLIDYSSTKGAIVALTIHSRKPRPNGKFVSTRLPQGRYGLPLFHPRFHRKRSNNWQRHHLGPARRACGSRSELRVPRIQRWFLFTGQVLHPNGREVVNA